MMSHALAPTGAIMAVISLGLAHSQGRPTWGTYWVWDARLTSNADPVFPLRRLHGAGGVVRSTKGRPRLRR